MEYTLKADPTGSADCSAEILRFFAQVPDGTPAEPTVAVIPPGRYRCEQTVELVGRHDLEVDGDGATLFVTGLETGTPRDREPFHLSRANVRLRSCERVEIHGLTVEGANPEGRYRPDYEGQHGFSILDGLLIYLQGCTSRNVAGDGVYLGRNTASGPLVCSVRGHHVDTTGRQGVAICSGAFLGVTESIITGVARTAFDLEPNHADDRVAFVQLTHNLVGTHHLNFLSSVSSRPATWVTVTGNCVQGDRLQMMVRGKNGAERSHWTIARNFSDKRYGSPDGAAFRFEQVADLTVTGNHQPLDPKRSMVLVDAIDCPDLSVADNTLPGLRLPLPGGTGQARLRHREPGAPPVVTGWL